MGLCVTAGSPLHSVAHLIYWPRYDNDITAAISRGRSADKSAAIMKILPGNYWTELRRLPGAAAPPPTAVRVERQLNVRAVCQNEKAS